MENNSNTIIEILITVHNMYSYNCFHTLQNRTVKITKAIVPISLLFRIYTYI